MANARLALVSPVASGASNVAHYLSTSNAFAAGDLFRILNQGTEKLALDYAGNLEVQGELRDKYNVKTYGAAGDGVTDDSVAIQAANDAAEALGGVVIFPPGTYRTTTRITVDGSVTWTAPAGATISKDHGGNGVWIHPAEVAGGACAAASAGDSTLTVSGAGWTVNEHAGKWVEIQDAVVYQRRRIVSNTADTLTLEFVLGADVAALTDLLLYTPIEGVRVENITIDDATASGSANWVIKFINTLTLRSIVSSNCAGNGVTVDSCETVRLHDGLSNTTQFGLFVYNSDDVRVDGFRALSPSGGHGIQLKDCRRARATGLYVYDSETRGIDIKGSGLNPCYDCLVSDSNVVDNASGVSFEIYVLEAEGTQFGAQNLQMMNCQSYGGVGGFRILDATVTAPGLSGAKFVGCSAYGGTTVGVTGAAQDGVFDSLWVEGFQLEGARATSDNVVLRHCTFKDNNLGGLNSSEVILSGNYCDLIAPTFTCSSSSSASVRAALLEGDYCRVFDARIQDTDGNYAKDYVQTGTGGIVRSLGGTLQGAGLAWNDLLERRVQTIGSAIDTFTSTDATPSVAFLTTNGRYFKTANGSATTITNFDQAVTGQEIVVIIGDANTTIDFTGTNLKGNGGSDWSPTTGDHMTCVFDGTNWYCNVSDNTA